jgi:hypothetical protein
VSLKLSNHPAIGLLLEKFESPIARFNLSGIRVSLALYLLAFGLYGYGSDLQILDPLSFLPLASGLLLSFFFATRPIGYFKKWTYQVCLRLKHLVALPSALVLLILATSNSLEDELVGDELSYLQLTVAHSLRVAELLPFLDQASEIGPLLQTLSFLLIAGFIVPALFFVALAPIRMTIVAVAIIVAAFQIAFSVMGGWGWGYAKVAWFPYLLPVSLLGPHSTVFRFTSLVIVAIGFTALFFTLRSLGLGAFTRATVVFLLIALPVPALFYSSLDHIVYFLAIALPAAVFLLSRPSDQSLELIFLVLSVAVLFRISIAFLLLAIALWVVGDKPYAKNLERLWRMAQPSLLLLVPYGLGVAFATPVLSNIAGPSNSIEVQLDEIMGIFVQQLGVVESVVVLCLLASAVIFSSRRAPIVVFIVLLASFYFLLLQPSGLAGVAKYSVEWALSLFLLALARMGMVIQRLRGKHIQKIVQASAFALIGVVAFLSSTSSFEANLFPKPNSAAAELNIYTPKGYEEAQDFLAQANITECAPVGVVYGAGNEILANRTLGVVKFAKKAHAELQDAQIAKGSNWTLLSAEAANSSRFNCLYGSLDAFELLDSKDWGEWTVTFGKSNLVRGEKAIVLQR